MWEPSPSIWSRSQSVRLLSQGSLQSPLWFPGAAEDEHLSGELSACLAWRFLSSERKGSGFIYFILFYFSVFPIHCLCSTPVLHAVRASLIRAHTVK